MALTSGTVTVTAGTTVAVHSTGPTSVTISNVGTPTVLIGTQSTPALPLVSGERVTLTIGATDVVYAKCVSATAVGKVAFFHA